MTGIDALEPAILEQLVRDAIEANLDMSEFEREQDLETGEAARIEAIRAQVETFMEENF